MDPTHAEEDGKSESDDDDEEDEEDDDDDDVFEPSTPKPEEAEAVGNDAPETWFQLTSIKYYISRLLI